MAQLPSACREAAAEAMNRHPTDVPTAVEETALALRSLPDFPAILEQLYRTAVAELVYDARHALNVQLKRDAGQYGGAPRFNAVTAEVVAAHRSLYDFCIGGTRIGDLRGADLAPLASRVYAQELGVRFNREICRWLATRVPPEVRVRDAIPEGELRERFRTLRQEIYANAEGEPEQPAAAG